MTGIGTHENWKRVQYIHRKMGFGVSLKEARRQAKLSSKEIINNILSGAKRQGTTPTPRWADWDMNKYLKLGGDELNVKLIERHLSDYAEEVVPQIQNRGFKERMTIFWSNHFVTEFWTYESPPLLYQYHTLLQRHGLRNFKDMTYKIGLNPAMLIYLNNNENTREHPNENYARELLELFTLGRDNNYTQKDISEIARAFTGYIIEDDGKVTFKRELHDSGEKTIFGKTGNWKYKDVIEILFSERKKEIAHHVCTKLYKEFIHFNPDFNFIKKIEKIFLENNFEIFPVLEYLFNSEEFLNQKWIGSKIKSPLEMTFIFMNEMNIEIEKEKKCIDLIHNCEWLGQALFNPPNVAGWQGNYHWLDASRLTNRWQQMEWVIYELIGEKNLPQLNDFVRELVGDEELSPYNISKSLLDYFLPKGLDESAYLLAEEAFKGEWDRELFGENGWWNFDRADTHWQVVQVLTHIFRLPEFQLV